MEQEQKIPQAHWVFPTPITEFFSNWSKEDNDALVECIRNKEKTDKAENHAQYSMAGKTGYHTKDDLLLSDESIIVKFKDLMQDVLNNHSIMVTGKPLAEDTKIVGWGMIYREGDHSLTHQHPLADLSACYYLEVPEIEKDTEEGCIVFLDPRPTGRFGNFSGNGLEIPVPAKAGVGLIFPSWLEHYVTPHYEKTERIALAINVFMPTCIGLETAFINKKDKEKV